VTARSLGKFFFSDGDTLERCYKDSLSGFREWYQLEHASDWVLIEENIGEHLKVKEVTMDLSESMADIVTQAFPNATIVLDCFHIMRRCNDAIEEMRLRCKREAQAKVRKEKSEFRKRQKRNAVHRRWYRKTHPKKYKGKTVNRCTIREIKSARDAIKSREDKVLNYFIERSTNASAESLNSKMKGFRARLRGVSDLPFFMYRLCQIFG